MSPPPIIELSRGRLTGRLVAASAALHLWLDRLDRLEDRRTPFSPADAAALDQVLLDARGAASRLGRIPRLPPGRPVAPGVAFVAVLKAMAVMARVGEVRPSRSRATGDRHDQPKALRSRGGTLFRRRHPRRPQFAQRLPRHHRRAPAVREFVR